MPITIVINPISGGGHHGRERAERAGAALAALDVTGDVVVSEQRGHAHALARAAVDHGATLVVAWGGDGTVNEVASALVHTAAALAIVPAGSGNGLARTLGVARRPAQAVADALGGRPRAIDAGHCGGGWFFSNAGVGLDAQVATCFDRDGAPRGLTTYARLTVREYLRYRPRRYRIDGVLQAQPSLLVTVANTGQLGNGAWIAPAARIDDGWLDLVVFDTRSHLGCLRAAPRLFTRGFTHQAGVSHRLIREVVVEDESPIPYHLDGDPKPPAPRLEFRVVPGALRVQTR